MTEIAGVATGQSTVVMALGGAGILLAAVLAFMAFSKKRVPLFLLLLAPVLTCAVGAYDAWNVAGNAIASLASTDADQVVTAASSGMYEALAADRYSRWVAAFLFACGAWAAGVGAFRAGPDTVRTLGAAVWVVVLTAAGAGAILSFGSQFGIYGATTIVALLVFGALGVLIGSFKRAVYEDADRVAGMRFASAVCLILSISYGGRALVMGNRMETFGPDGAVTQAHSLLDAIGMWNEVAVPVVSLAWMAYAFAVFIGFAAFYKELGEVVARKTLVDVVASLLLVGTLTGARVVEESRIDQLAAISTNEAARVVFADIGGDLATSLVAVDDGTLSAHPVDGGFGDVLAYIKVRDPETGAAIGDPVWQRVFRWTGEDWEPDATPLDQVQFNSGLRPLIAVGSGEDALVITDIIEKAGGEGLLLLRAEEVKATVEIPPELEYLQVTFLPLTLASERDLSAELWRAAESRRVNWGPTTWFGEQEDDEPLAYHEAVYADTEAPGVHVLVGEKSRVKGLVASCLPAVSRLAEDGRIQPGDGWCHLTVADEDEVRREAMEAWEPPTPEHFTASFGRAPTMVSKAIGGDFAVDRLVREFAAVDYCLSDAVDEGEEIDGQMRLNVTFTRKGAVSVDIHERSRNQNEFVYRCFRNRFKAVKFAIDEEQWPAPAEDAPEIDPQTLELTLNLRS